MTLSYLLSASILCFFIPLWMIAGFADWLFHRHSRISETSGVKESLLHLLMIGEIGVPMLAGLFLEINALVIGLMIAGFLAHEATVLWDLRYAASKRRILPGEQIIHSFQELIPLTVLALVIFLHWEQFEALVTMSDHAHFVLAWKRDPLAPGHLMLLLAGAAVLVVLPFVEELWRCYRHEGRQQRATSKI